MDSLIGVISLLLLSEKKNRSILEAMTKKKPETVLFHTASGLENTGFLKLTSKPLTGYSNSSRVFYRQLINTDISYILDTSISPNIALFASFSKLLVAN